jgi:hypothetical protein
VNTVSEYFEIQSTICIIKFGPRFIWTSAAKPDPFFWVETNFGPKIWVKSGRIGPQGHKMGPIRLGWPQIGFKFGFIPIMFLINPNEPNLNSILGRVWHPGSKFGLSWVGPPGSKFRLSQVRLVGFTRPDLNLQSFRC